MIRTLLTTTALAALLATGAIAQDTAAPGTNSSATTVEPFDLGTGYQAVDTDDLASRILGQPVYTSAANDADNIGDINDLVIDDSGDIRAVIIGVGGFLGAGEKNVAVDFGKLQMVIAEDNTERWVLETTQEALNAAPAFEFIDDQPADTAANAAGTMAPADNAAAPADQTAATATTDPAADPNAAQAQIDRTALTNVDASALTAEELIGTRVVGPDNQQIAEVGDLVLTEDGKIDAVLVDFGGFLGIGEKRVAVAMDNLQFLSDENNNRYVFLENVTKEQLDAAPAYDEATYAQTRDTQRLTLGAM